VTAVLLAAGLAVVCGLALAGAVGLRWRGQQAAAQTGLAPRNRAKLMAAALAAAAAVVCCGLSLLAIPAVLGLLPRSVCPAWAAFVYGGGPAARAGEWFAVGVLLVSKYMIAARALRCRRELRALRVEGGIGTHERWAGFDVVTVPSPALVAYSIRGGSPQIVLSDGLRDLLDGQGRTAVLAHEAAHLRARHSFWLYLLSLVEAALWFAPWVRRSADAIRLSLERWADEDAADQVGRQAVRSALITAAGIAPLPAMAAALRGADAMATRLTALAAPRSSSRLRWADMDAMAAMAAMAIMGIGALCTALIAIHGLYGR
jgi:Zn-dependent protease with chaperone function